MKNQEVQKTGKGSRGSPTELLLEFFSFSRKPPPRRLPVFWLDFLRSPQNSQSTGPSWTEYVSPSCLLRESDTSFFHQSLTRETLPKHGNKKKNLSNNNSSFVLSTRTVSVCDNFFYIYSFISLKKY